MTKRLSTKEMSEILDKMQASTENIKRLGCIGKNRALEIKKEIKSQMTEDNMVCPRNLVSMEYVIKYFKIDEKQVRRRIAMGGIING